MIRFSSDLLRRPVVLKCAVAAALCVGVSAPFAEGAVMQVNPQPEEGIEVAEDARTDDATIAMDDAGSINLESPIELSADSDSSEQQQAEQQDGQEASVTTDGIFYLDENENEQNTGNAEVIDISDKSFKDKGGYELGDGWYVVKSSREFSNRLNITGDAKLILCDGVVANFKKGIRGKSGKFTIYSQSTGKSEGKLIATAKEGSEDAGIGGNDEESNKTEIVICGGRIEASTDEYAAGIGGGDHGGCGTIRILNGSITANGGGIGVVRGAGAGIGSGDGAKEGGTVEILGGVVNATGPRYAAGIGTGDEAKKTVAVTIWGGNVTAKSKEQGAGIGGGNESTCDVSIHGGAVHANGGKWGAGIGTGDEAGCGKVNITGGDIVASGGKYAAGIGGGNESRCNVTISGGKVAATGGEWGAGIGTGDECDKPGTITISGGDVKATAGDKGAGIGGGNECDGGTITITGGRVKAFAPKGGGLFSNSGGAGIGGGDEGKSGDITIDGGTVQAEAKGKGARAIGHGDWQDYTETISVNNDLTIMGNKDNIVTTDHDRWYAVKNWHWIKIVPNTQGAK